jgi:hypothetical protein
MSRLHPSLIPLDKGLNLQTAKIAAPEGSILDMLNYEQVDFQGQKRIDGYVRYDGTVGAHLDDYYVAVLNTYPQNYEVGELVYNNGNLMGILVGASLEPYDALHFALIDKNQFPKPGDVLTHYPEDEGYDIGVVKEAGSGREYAGTSLEHYSYLNIYNNVLRSLVGTLPGPVAGLHWFRDRLYAVASLLAVRIDRVLSDDTPINIEVSNDTGQVAKLVKVDNSSGNSVLYLGAVSPELWTPGQQVYRYDDGTDVGTVTSVTVQSEVASFFVALNEVQGSGEAGWRWINNGWVVPFVDGVSLYGNLPSLNQNVQYVGVQGPTGTQGNNGSFLALKQKVAIQDKPTQVNGWKSTATPSSYEVLPSSIKELDDSAIYADAFISWDKVSGQLLAPGLTGTIPEYSPTATAKITEVE